MYARRKRVERDGKVYEYVQVVECRRVDGKPRQRMVETLGRLESRSPAEALQIAVSLVRFLKKQAGESANGDAGALGTSTGRQFGRLVAIEEAWRALGLDRIFKRLAEDRRFAFPPERALFAMVAQRLIAPSSKLACVDWLRHSVQSPSIPKLDEDDLYATLSWLEAVTLHAELRLFEKLTRDGKCDPVALLYDTTATWF